MRIKGFKMWRCCAGVAMAAVFNGLACQAEPGPWTYIQVDDSRSARFFGINAADLNGDGPLDIASGQYVYLNPGGDMTGAWKRVGLPQGHDALLIPDVDGDAFADLISMTSDGKVYWLEAQNAGATAWSATEVGTLPRADHKISSQGYELVQVIAGGKPEAVINAGGVHYFQIPGNPGGGGWPMTKVADGTSESVGYGDIDRDGKIDLLAQNRDAENVGREVAWYKNPGDGSGNWTRHHLGSVENWCDRIEVADYNGDGRLDVACAEETGSREPRSASVFWFEAPADPAAGNWTRHRIVAQYTSNSMDQADMNGDGAPDLITGEHRGTEKLAIWLNDGKGSFTEHMVGKGKENHLGARVFDLDRDGDFDIIGIAWDDYKFLHLWRNDATK